MGANERKGVVERQALRNIMRKKLKILTIATIITAVMLAMVTAAFVVTKMSLNDELETNAQQAMEMAQNRQTVYVVCTYDGSGIAHGEILKEDTNVVKQTVYTGLEPYNYITEEDLGSTAIVDIYEGMTVMANMVTPLEIATDSREYEIQVANLMVDQRENDYIDIRIMFPDGSDYLVLPKKQVKNLSLENCVFWTYLNEEEILRMASATIDAFTITGTKIYAARYVESNLQKEAVPTYLVNATVQDMMDSTSAFYDKNLLTKAITTLNALARKNMEERLALLSEEKLSAVSEGHGIEDTAKNAVLTGLGGYDYEKAVSDPGGSLQDASAVETEKENTDSMYGTEIPGGPQTPSTEGVADDGGKEPVKGQDASGGE